jgi:hypothetical protein
MNVSKYNKLISYFIFLLAFAMVLIFIGWEVHFIKDYETLKTSLNVLYLATLLHMVLTGEIFSSKYLITILFFFALPQIMLLEKILGISVLNNEHRQWAFLNVTMVSQVGVIITYYIHYKSKVEKSLIDKLKLAWILVLCLSNILFFILRMSDISYADLLEKVDLVVYIPLVLLFYERILKLSKTIIK